MIGLGLAAVLIYALVIGSMYAECAVTPAYSGGFWDDVCEAGAFWSMFAGGALVVGILLVLVVVWEIAAARDDKKLRCPRCGYRVAKGAARCGHCGVSFSSGYTSSFPRPPGTPPPPPPPPFSLIPEPAPARRTSALAIVSLVFGIIGGWVLALPFGYIAKRQIDASSGIIGGRGLAIAGIVLGWVGCLGTVGAVLAAQTPG